VKTLDDQDHYEVLEVPWGAKPAEIERAYRIAHSAYAPESLALYSMFDEDDAHVIRARIEQAHHVLSDESLRADYDARLVASGTREPEPEPGPAYSAPIEGDPGESVELVVGRGSEVVTSLSDFDDIEALGPDDEDEDSEWSGERLRRARLRRGVELEEIGDVTKVSPGYLRCIEEDRFDDLPAAVYVRGFVGSYARTIGLDPRATAASYMRHLEVSTHKSPRSRLLGRS